MVLGNGATDCLYRMAATLKPKTAVLIEPTFSEYRKALSLHGCDVYSLSYDFKASKTMAERIVKDFITSLFLIQSFIFSPLFHAIWVLTSSETIAEFGMKTKIH
jgi:histidinol-phosphate/aromatic aminotransferase/cobyric acid decarboxylase-like protein